MRPAVAQLEARTLLAASLGSTVQTGSRMATESAEMSAAPTTIEVTADPNPANAISDIILTATVRPAVGAGIPTGIVAFTVNGRLVWGATIHEVNGVATATFTERDLSNPGAVYHVAASYRGDSDFAYSVSPTLDVVLNHARSVTTLDVTPNPANSNDNVVLTEKIQGYWFSAVTGTVTFFDADRVLGTQAVVEGTAYNGYGATLILPASALGTGFHSLRASYGGDSVFVLSTSNPRPLKVAASEPPKPPPPTPPLPPADGPRVVGLERFGYHMMPTRIVVRFDSPLDVSRAQNAANYHLANAIGRPIGVRSASYDPDALTVTLVTRRRLNVHRHYNFTIDGATSTALTDPTGQALDGDADGTPGGSYAARIDRRILVLNRPAHLLARRLFAARASAHALHAEAARERMLHQAGSRNLIHRTH
jgi:hypothetical protein